MTKVIPSVDYLRLVFRYDPENGKLYWRARPREMFKSDRDWRAWNTLYAEKEAFYSKDRKGYLYGTLLGGKHRAHRVIWAIVKGIWPEGEIDHEDGVRDNNRFVNLSDVTTQANRKNACLVSHNTSGVNGVYRNNKTNKWAAQIKIDGWPQHLGTFESFDDAVAARAAADVKYGFSARHGKPL